MATYDATGIGEQTVGGLIVRHLAAGERVTSGSGIYAPFLHIDSNGPSSIGYNSDENGNPVNVGSSQTEALTLSEIPIIYRGGVAYYEFRLDINEPNNGDLDVSLETLRIYTSGREATLTDYNNGFSAAGVFTTVYDLDAGGDSKIVLRDDSNGGGTDDYAFYLPVSAFTGDPANTYVTFVSQFGPDPAENAGFEEWRTQDVATISGIKFSDLDGDKIQDGNEPGLPGFTVYIDANNNNQLDAGEASTVSGAGGVFNFYGLPVGEDPITIVIREALTATQAENWLLTTGVGGDHSVIIADPQTYAVKVGNMPIIKEITVDKTVDSITGGTQDGKADSAGDVINYLISITNSGNVPLTNVTLTDPNATNITYLSGDTGNDQVLGVGEVWIYSAKHTVTQAELDSDGGGDRDIDNTATGHAFYNATEVLDTDDAAAPLVFDPELDIQKDLVNVTNGNDPVDNKADKAGDVINYHITVANTGNITLTNIVVDDSQANPGSIVRVLPNVPSALDDGDNLLEVGEIWNYTAQHTVTQADLDAQIPAGENGIFVNTAGADSTETPRDTDDAETPLVYDPELNIQKDLVNVTNGNDPVDNKADKAGDVINYHITVANTGNITLSNIVVSDLAADANSIVRVLPNVPSALDDGDDLLEVGEIWNYTAQHTVTQDELDDKGDGTGNFVNTATADSDESGPDDDDASTPLVYDDEVDLEKLVSVDGGVTFEDADNPKGPETSLNAPVMFQIIVANTGNITLTDITLTDTKYDLSGATLYLDANKDDVLDATETTAVTSLAPGEQAILYYSLDYATGQHTNTATVNTAEGATDLDAAHYFGLVNAGPGVRTPGFWSNLGYGFWDGVAGLPKQAGKPGFADKELLYAVDSNHNGSVGAGDVAGLLIGDFNGDGIEGPGEDTFFIPLALAQQLINASQKDTQDARFMLGRDVVATWLNHLAGNNIGDASDPHSPKALLMDAVDWFQTYADADHNDIMDLAKGDAIKTSSPKWSAPGDGGYGAFVSGAEMHTKLDNYNNDGSTSPGHDYAGDADSSLFLFALANIV
jgi:uncharacterized repeat protein (TIGR01451 family)